MIRNIVFDMGMVMLDYHPIEACRHFCPGDEAMAQQLHKLIFGSPEWVELDHGTLTELEALPRMLARTDSPLLHEKATLVFAHWTEYSMSPYPEMGEVVRALKATGKHIYLLSNASLRLRSYQHLIPAIELFDGLMVSSEEKLLKPDPAIYLRLCERFDLKPEECCFVDDIEGNCEGARSVGMTAIRCTGDVPALRAALGLE